MVHAFVDGRSHPSSSIDDIEATLPIDDVSIINILLEAKKSNLEEQKRLETAIKSIEAEILNDMAFLDAANVHHI